MRGIPLAGCLALSGPVVLSFADTLTVQPTEDPPVSPQGDPGQHLAVVVPVYRGDLSRAVSSLDRWPSTCSPLTEQNADLVLYYAEGEEDAPAVTAAVDTINETAGRCFAKTRLVYAHLSEEEDVYPKGPSVMFFKMFLDESVHSELSEYDALAIVEWDVLVASDRSFEELHHAAFRGNEDFWVKGSNLGGTNFHSVAQASDMWNMLGHINGNAIYNNNDPAFVEYVDYTRTRWEYTYPYDVALWLTISDFPYSWPLWQRYSSKFVTTNLISYVGFEHVDHTTVSDAIAGQTLFIHGSRVEEGNLASLKATKHERSQAYAASRHVSGDIEVPPVVCNAACGTADITGLPAGTSTVCDDTCAGESARFGGLLCGAGDSDKFGHMCRLCYVDIEEAHREETLLALKRSDLEDEQASHVIMCDTMRPPEAAECSDKCGRKKDTVCDESCGTGRHGDYNCNWRDHGAKCRFCFEDLETALMADNVAQRRGGRVIMCSTFEPPQAMEQEEPDILPIAPRRRRATRSRKLQAWKDNEKWKTADKWVGKEKWRQGSNDDDTPKWKRDEKWKNDSDDEEPKWKENEKWKNNYCDEELCPHTNVNGYRGRVCDESCADGDPYGTNGCSARDGRHGDYCRVCYIDRDRAIANDDPDDRAIMCDTVLPVSTYESSSSRRLTTATTESAPGIGQKLRAWKDTAEVDEDVHDQSNSEHLNRKLQAWKDNEKWKTAGKWVGKEKWRQDSNDDDTPKWQREEKWKNDSGDEEPKWKENEKWKNNYCDEELCPHTNVNGYRGRVCDESCADGDPYGTNGCSARDGRHGDYCRVCYIDRDRAIANDDPDDRAIMCDTVLPVSTYESSSSRRLTTATKESAPGIGQTLRAWKDVAAVDEAVNDHSKGERQNRKLQAWKDNEKWKTADKWKQNEKWRQDSNDDDTPKWQRDEKWKNDSGDEEPKWKENEKWKNNYCDEELCPHTNVNGYRGRVCDDSCADGDPYGTNGCSARDGRHGDYCRVCYIGRDRAIANDDPDDRAIMCDTVLPVSTYESSSSRRLTTATNESAPGIGQTLRAWKDSAAVNAPANDQSKGEHQNRKLQAWKDNEKWKTAGKWVGKEKWRQDSNDDDTPKWQREEKWKNDSGDEEPKWKQNEKWKNNYCDEELCPHTNVNGYRGRVCDESCADGDPYGTNGCSARDGRHGDYCRVCYIDRDRAIANDDPDDRAIMCDTVLPVTTYEASSSRRLAAATTKSAPSIVQTLKAWKDRATISGGVHGKPQRIQKNRKLQAWKDNEKWKTADKWVGKEKWRQDSNDDDIPKWQRDEKWKNDSNDDEEPKWKQNEKWKNNFCDEELCPHTNVNGYRGRVCDESCADGDPYGTNGCSARDGRHGDYCRVCYIDRDRAIANDDPDDRAIMCDTVLPVTAYESSSPRRLAASTKESDLLGLPLAVAEVEDVQSMFADATVLPYTNDLVRGNLCAFIAGHLNEVDQVEVAVMSVLQFLPGMTVAVAVDNAGFEAYERAVGGLPGVTVHTAEDPFTASLNADMFCGVDTSLIFYMQRGSVVSRQFTSKDTHSPNGDLLVVYGNAKVSHVERELAKQATKVLGFESPSFTFNTDLFLPVGANADLRKVLVSGLDPSHQDRDGQGGAFEAMKGYVKLRDMSAVPQLMAALSYSRNTPGVWFIDPQTWVSQHLFRAASIWEIPLVKPRYTCSIDQSIMRSDLENIDVGGILQSNLDFLTHGGTCDSGNIDTRRGD